MYYLQKKKERRPVWTYALCYSTDGYYTIFFGCV